MLMHINTPTPLQRSDTMTTGTLILNIALMVAVSIVLVATMIVVPNMDRLHTLRRQRKATRTPAAAARRDQRGRGALPTAT
jgi:hypothetical protein